MFAATRIVTVLALATAVAGVRAADLPKESPFQQAGNATATAASTEPLEFAGVSTVGKKTMINLYDRQQKHGFWVELGATSEGVTALKYDNAHDQVTVRRDGVEKTLPLRSASGVTNGPGIAVPVMQPPPAIPAPATTPAVAPPAGAGTQSTMDTAARTRARQEEEARMLVSDLLEIGMAQRKAYEEAQRRAASGQTSQPTPGTPAPSAATAPIAPDGSAAAPTTGQTAAPVATTTPSGG